VQLVKAIVRAFSYVYHAVLALFLAAVAGLTLMTSPQSLHLDMLPWTGSTLAYVVFFSALFGLATVILAVNGTLRPLFFLWSLAVTVMMIRGFFFSGYRFSPGSSGPAQAAWLILGSLVALAGAWWRMMQPLGGARRRY
jgi:hypothetical protein